MWSWQINDINNSMLRHVRRTTHLTSGPSTGHKSLVQLVWGSLYENHLCYPTVSIIINVGETNKLSERGWTWTVFHFSVCIDSERDVFFIFWIWPTCLIDEQLHFFFSSSSLSNACPSHMFLWQPASRPNESDPFDVFFSRHFDSWYSRRSSADDNNNINDGSGPPTIAKCSYVWQIQICAVKMSIQTSCAHSACQTLKLQKHTALCKFQDIP